MLHQKTGSKCESGRSLAGVDGRKGMRLYLLVGYHYICTALLTKVEHVSRPRLHSDGSLGTNVHLPHVFFNRQEAHSPMHPTRTMLADERPVMAHELRLMFAFGI